MSNNIVYYKCIDTGADMWLAPNETHILGIKFWNAAIHRCIEDVNYCLYQPCHKIVCTYNET